MRNKHKILQITFLYNIKTLLSAYEVKRKHRTYWLSRDIHFGVRNKRGTFFGLILRETFRYFILYIIGG